VSAPNYEAHTCGLCGGNGAHWPNAEVCAPCMGSGEQVPCLGCGADMPEPQAFEEGAFCTDCRAGEYRDERAA